MLNMNIFLKTGEYIDFKIKNQSIFYALVIFKRSLFFFFDKTVKQIIAFIGHLRKFLCGNIFSVFQTFFDGAIKMVFIKINIQGKKEKMY